MSVAFPTDVFGFVEDAGGAGGDGEGNEHDGEEGEAGHLLATSRSLPYLRRPLVLAKPAVVVHRLLPLYWLAGAYGEKGQNRREGGREVEKLNVLRYLFFPSRFVIVFIWSTAFMSNTELIQLMVTVSV